MSISTNRRAPNQLIAAMPAKDRAIMLADCESVELTFGEVLYESREPIAHVYFPVIGFISLMTTLKGHPPLEMGLIGDEGMLGVTLALGIKAAPMHAVVQGPGTSLRLTTAQFNRNCLKKPGVVAMLDRYLFVLTAQLSQSAACTRFHEIEPRLARWLLMTHDRAHADHFHLTHEYLAEMLGVRRSGVSIAASALQARNLIHYSRGEINILNRKGLEAASCECYQAMRQDYEEILG